MALLPEEAIWEDGIRQLELDDPVQGGPDGVDNIAPRQLANRTKYLKDEVDALKTQSTGHIGTGGNAHAAATQAAAGFMSAADKAKLDGIVNPLLKSGGTMTGALILADDPTDPLGATTKQYVDARSQGLVVKVPARAATTANIILNGLQTVDGVVLAAGDRVLVKDQAAGAQNGIYLVTAGDWTRATDANEEAELRSAYVLVMEGTINLDTAWVMTTDGALVIGTTTLTFTKFQNASEITASGGIQRIGNNLSIDPAAMRLWKPNTAYAVGDICYSLTAASHLRFECVIPGDTGPNEPAWTGVGTLVSDGTVTWIVDDVRDGTPVGRTVPEVLTAARAGYLKANGALVARASYPRLWVWANASGLVATEANWAAGQTGRFADGDGATTFRLPDLRAEFIRGLDDSRGVDAARVMGAAQVDDLKSHIHNIYLYSRAVAGSGGVPIISDQAVSPTEYSGTDRIKAAGGAETRPRNIAYLYCIKY